MTTGLSYDGSVAGTASYVTQIAEMAVVPATDANYVAILPAMITYAENRIYRDLDFLVTVNTGTYSVTGGNRQVEWRVCVIVQAGPDHTGEPAVGNQDIHF